VEEIELQTVYKYIQPMKLINSFVVLIFLEQRMAGPSVDSEVRRSRRVARRMGSALGYDVREQLGKGNYREQITDNGSKTDALLNR
jgi:hypothetical protein